jgi:hypothetical protein
MEVTEEAWRGIACCRPGQRVGDIGHATHAEGQGYSVVREFVGPHRDPPPRGPPVPNYWPPGRRERLVPDVPGHRADGQRLRAGGAGAGDGLDLVTVDGSLSAHFELSVAVTRAGPRVPSDLPYGQGRESHVRAKTDGTGPEPSGHAGRGDHRHGDGSLPNAPPRSSRPSRGPGGGPRPGRLPAADPPGEAVVVELLAYDAAGPHRRRRF